jgi:2-(1,2-epoxy-1,2-dihydrophenyl)acetyl-CoA isomerase
MPDLSTHAEQSVLYAVTDGIAVLTLNRPAALNAFTAQMHGLLLPAMEAAAADPGVRALVLTGAGRGFCAGQALDDPAMLPGADGAPDVGAVVERHYRPLAMRIRTMPVPVIAAVNGVAAGAGASIALGCDMVIAARSASFVQAFARIGLIPDAGGTWLLPRLVGRAQALGLALTGDRLGAERAAQMGLIWQCVEDVELMPTALALAHKLAAMPSRALAQTRAALDEAGGLGFDAALQMEARRQGELGRAHDFAEGVAAFLGKRTPQFKDR